jgi:hypothetical protein
MTTRSYYTGFIEANTGDAKVYACDVGGDNFLAPLSPRLDLRNHSPTGFQWGYGGSGPAQLALAILADHLGNDEEALFLYQDFKWKVISKLPGEQKWELTPAQIDAALAEIAVTA